MWDFTSERIAVKSRTGSCGRFHSRTHFYGGILFGGIHVCGEGGTSMFDPEWHQRLAALGGSRSCATADGTPVDTGAKNCVPPISAIDGARRGGIVVEAWGRRLFTISFCVRRNWFLCVRGKKTYDDMIELQPSASLGTLRVVVFGRGDRECREWVKPPREPHAIQTVRSCNRYATCLTCSSSLSGSSLPISRFSRSPRAYPSHPHAPILPISTANPITFPILLLFVVLGVFVSVICHHKA